MRMGRLGVTRRFPDGQGKAAKGRHGGGWRRGNRPGVMRQARTDVGCNGMAGRGMTSSGKAGKAD